MQRTFTIALFTALSIILAAPAFAATTEKTPGETNVMDIKSYAAAMDTNKDGKVSKQEYLDFHAKRNADTFDMIDDDGDAMATEAEIADLRTTITKKPLPTIAKPAGAAPTVATPAKIDNQPAMVIPEGRPTPP